MASVNEYWDQIKTLLGKFSFAQRISLAAITIGLIVGFGMLMSLASKPNYEVLFSNLNPKDAGKIIDELKTDKIEYKVDAGGTMILIPEEQVYEQRMKFANLGIPQEGIVGYEIFDQTKLGMTDFVQKLNYHRALEGELSRTLTGIEEIVHARVHIVVPKPALFEEDKKLTTASVVLGIRGSSKINTEQIQGIANIIASSVEGLSTDNIAILDSKGNILSSDLGKEEGIALSSAQYDVRRQVERYLEDKAQSLLLSALGSGRSIVRVTADLNFNRIEKTTQTFDPEGQVVRSEEVATQATSSGTQNPPNSTANSREDDESTVTNYEISNTLEHMVNSFGNIERLSVAVLVDGHYQTNENAEGVIEKEYQERSPEELGKLTAIVKNAIGFNPSRGDQISLSSMPFDDSKSDELETEFAQAAQYEFWQDIIQKAILLIFALAILLTMRWLMRRAKQLASEVGMPKEVAMAEAGAVGMVQMRPGVPTMPGTGVGSQAQTEEMRRRALEEVGRMEDQMSFESIKKAELQKKLVEYIADKPDEATQLVRTWIYEEAQ